MDIMTVVLSAGVSPLTEEQDKDLSRKVDDANRRSENDVRARGGQR
ncbi:hypothetical protein ACFV3E_36725 [Streptomyces sp. NPDC059718]